MKLKNLIEKIKGFTLVDMFKDFWEIARMNEPRRQYIAMASVCTAVALMALFPTYAFWLILLAPVAFIQNMFFTLVSRSRNSQDPDYHRYCAWGSNGVWFICQVMIVKNIWGAIMAGQWWYAIAAGVVYSLATTEGSVLMMKRLIRAESGKRRVGASDKLDKMEARLAALEDHVASGRINNRLFTPLNSGLPGFSPDAVAKEFVDTTEDMKEKRYRAPGPYLGDKK